MASNNTSDREHLIDNLEDNPPTYQDATNPRYGTFNGPSTTVVADASTYPYIVGSQQPTVIILGGCPACKVGMLESEFTCTGLCCALFLFPIGILCCLALRQRRCNFCGAIFD